MSELTYPTIEELLHFWLPAYCQAAIEEKNNPSLKRSMIVDYEAAVTLNERPTAALIANQMLFTPETEILYTVGKKDLSDPFVAQAKELGLIDDDDAHTLGGFRHHCRKPGSRVCLRREDAMRVHMSGYEELPDNMPTLDILSLEPFQQFQARQEEIWDPYEPLKWANWKLKVNQQS